MIILLGAGGFIGYCISKALDENNIPFGTVSRSFQWQSFNSETRINSPVSSVENYCDLITSNSRILYMAGSPDLFSAEQDPSLDLSKHIKELELFFADIKYTKKRPKMLAFVSSAGTVYGDCNNIMANESDKLKPKSAYGRRNVILEALFSLSAEIHSQSHCILRISNPFGPMQFQFRRKGLIQALLTSSVTGNEVILRGSGKQKRDYVFSSDLGLIFKLFFELESVPQIMNISSGFSYSARDLVDLLNAKSIYPNVKYIRDQLGFEVRDSIVNNSIMCNLLSLKSTSLNPFDCGKLESMFLQ